MGAVISGIVAAMKAIPALERMVFKITDMFTQQTIGKVDGKHHEHVVKRRAVYNAIRNAKTNDDRKALSIVLHDINNPKL